MDTFERELAALLNRYSVENESNTPDFILAKYLQACLLAYAAAVGERERWYGVNAVAPTPATTPKGE